MMSAVTPRQGGAGPAMSGGLLFSMGPLAAGDPRATDESAIVEAVLAGDRDAFRILVERESASVVRACHRILGDAHEAEDAAQEAFVTAYRALGSWRGEGPFGAWVSRIAVRIALREVAKRRPVTWIDPTDSTGASDRGSVAGLTSGPSADPLGRALRGERESAVRDAVARLEEPYREVVSLRFFGERSLDEIATLTGRPLSTVKTHLHRGLNRLRDRLHPEQTR